MFRGALGTTRCLSLKFCPCHIISPIFKVLDILVNYAIISSRSSQREIIHVFRIFNTGPREYKNGDAIQSMTTDVSQDVLSGVMIEERGSSI